MKPVEKLKVVFEVNKEIKNVCNVVLHPFLVGDAGTGKTSMVIKTDLFPDTYVVDLSTVLKEDLTGLPVIKDGQTVWTTPEWINHDTILFDEFDKSGELKQNVVLSFLTTLRLRNIPLKEKQFIFTSQPSFLLSLIESREADDFARAILTRFIFIRLNSEDSADFLSNKLGWRTPIIFKSNIEEELNKSFKLGAETLNYRVLEYMTYFLRELKNRYKENYVDVFREIFDYVDRDIIDLIVEREQNRDITDLTPEELRELIPAMNVYELIEVLPKIQTYLEPKEFFNLFIKIYNSSSKDEREVFFNNLTKSVYSNENFLATYNSREIARYFVYTTYYLLKTQNPNDSFIGIFENKIARSKYRKEFEEFMKEVQQ